MSLRSDVLYSLKWMAAIRFVSQIFNWAVTLVVIRLLEPSDYGLFSMAGVLIGFATLFRELGLYAAIVRKRDVSVQQIEQSFGFMLIVNTFIYGILFVCAPFLAGFFDDSRLTDIVRVLGIQFPISALGVVQQAMLSRSMSFKKISFVNLGASVANGFVTLICALSGYGVWALIYGSLVSSVMRAIGLMLANRQWYRPRLPRADMSDMMRFGGFVTTTRLLTYVNGQAAVLIIGKMLGQDILGFYTVGLRLAALPMTKVGEMLNQVGLAAFSSIQDDMEAIRSHFCKATRLLSFLAFPIFWGISSISPEFVLIVLGQNWEPAIIPLQLISLAMPFRMISQPQSTPLEAINKPHIMMQIRIITLMIMAPAFFAGAWYWGLLGVSMVWLTAYPFVWLIRMYIILPHLGLSSVDYIKSILGPASGGAIMYISVISARQMIAEPFLKPAFGLVFLIGIGIVVYTAFMWFQRRNDCVEFLDLVK